jgi:membrane-associated phospholipid phosphatase
MVYWKQYEYKGVFIFLGLTVFMGFWFGSTYTDYDDETLKRINHIFWLSLLSLILNEIAVQGVIKHVVFRPRPLSELNANWNFNLRVLADENIKHGTSYVSGHASALFAVLTPVFWNCRKKVVKISALSWAILNAYSRVYVAAHFFYCAFMGSIIGRILGIKIGELSLSMFTFYMLIF